MRKKRNRNIIYSLHDPISHQLKYVGITSDIGYRLRSHIRTISEGTEKERWISLLYKKGKVPYVRILDIVTDKDRVKAERDWINKLRSIGYPLLNDQSALRPVGVVRDEMLIFRAPLSRMMHELELEEKQRVRVFSMDIDLHSEFYCIHKKAYHF